MWVVVFPFCNEFSFICVQQKIKKLKIFFSFALKIIKKLTGWSLPTPALGPPPHGPLLEWHLENGHF
jgi:hypothetical protein